MTQEAWAGIATGFFIAAGLVLFGMVLSWLEERERKKQAPVVEEHAQLVAMPGMDEPRTQPLPAYSERFATTVDEIKLLPEVVVRYPARPSAQELRRRIDETLDLMEKEKKASQKPATDDEQASRE